jgi:hypothetical protein
MMHLQFQSSTVAHASCIDSHVIFCYNEIFKIVFHLILDVIFKVSYAFLTVMGIHCNDGFFFTIINSSYHELALPFTVHIQTKFLLCERSTAMVIKN